MKVNFQTNNDGTSALTTIENYAFYDCESIETLILPEGLVTIGNNTFQYNFGLISITLPNTLKTIGRHFVCCAKELKSLVIPASVETMDGACFHGCNSLEEVYMLGTAASLKRGTGNDQTFGDNAVFCQEGVSNCKFYTTEDYVKSYAQGENNSVWNLIADNRDSAGFLIDENGQRIKDDKGNEVKATGTPLGRDNQLLVITDVNTNFTYKWVTACFPEGLEE